jgi:phage terminase large subunit GpA-like protein
MKAPRPSALEDLAPMQDGRRLVLDTWRAGLRPDPDLLLSEWAQKKLILPSTSSEPGPYRCERTPYCVEPMDRLAPADPCEELVLMWASQVGKSTIGNAWMGYIADQAPGPTMLVQPTTETAKDYAQDRIDAMIAATPALKEKFATRKSRDESNSARRKSFPGGFLAISGGNSAASLSSKPIRYLFLDEIDRYPMDVDGQGDPVGLAKKRQDTFARRKTLETSTPTTKDFSRIEAAFEASDQRRYFVPCPHCEEKQVLRWRGLRWRDGNAETAHYVCEHCGAEIEERFKTQMLERGEWRPTAEGTPRVRGYHLSALYSPLGWRSWAAIVRSFLEAQVAKAKGDLSKLKKWTNLDLGETFEEAGESTEPHVLSERAEAYELGTVPFGGLVLVGSVDVQGNRLEVLVEAYGREDQTWTVDYKILHGDPAEAVVWTELDEYLRQPFRHQSGAELYLLGVAIDSGGHHTQRVYSFTRSRRHRRIIAVKGQSVAGKPPIGKPSEVEVNFQGVKLKKGAQVWPVGSDTIKSLLHGRLRIEHPGPGYMHHSSDLPEEFYEQLTSEQLITRFRRGVPLQEWHLKKGRRNEVLDLKVYNYAAACMLGIPRYRVADWDRIELKVQPMQLELRLARQADEQQQTQAAPEPAAAAPAPAPEDPPKTAASPRTFAAPRRPGGFVNRWRLP